VFGAHTLNELPVIDGVAGDDIVVNTKVAALSHPILFVRCTMYVPEAL
jgi:hypothetical protein